jgi:glyoxylase-like metal-dependent hydrolase (beta-lactamase superfamily II)
MSGDAPSRPTPPTPDTGGLAPALTRPRLVFRQLFDPASSTYTYLLGDAERGEAVLIDPVLEQVERDTALLGELGLRLVYTLETHVHADHVTSGEALRARVGSRGVVGEHCNVACADVRVRHGDTVRIGAVALEVRATPGHTDGCITFVLHDARMAFTGDALLIRGTGRTDFQQGDARALYRSIHEQIFSLPSDFLLYPGHDYKGQSVTSVAEERQFNPRVGGSRTVEEFVIIMRELKLAYPKQMDVAVPANLACGRVTPPQAG